MHNRSYLNILLNSMFISIDAYQMKTCQKNWTEKKKNQFYRLWIVNKGKLKITYNEETYILHEKEMFLFRENEQYEAKALCDNTQFLYINFLIYDGISKDKKIDFIPVYGKKTYNEMKEETDLILKYQLSNSNPFYKPLKSFYSGALLIIISSYCEYLYKDKIYVSNNKITFEPPQISKIAKYINEHKGDKLTTEFLSKKFNISQKTLYNQFKKYYGHSAHDYVWQTKIKYAIELIHSKKYSIKEIASMVGYDDPKTFTSVFKRWMKVPPSKFNV